MNPALYPGDVMVATAESFPTVFYRALSALLPGTDSIPAAFFVLYVLSIAATLAGAYRLGQWAGGPAAGVVALVFAMPVRIGLAGEALYRVEFSHSHVASALTIWAIVWFVEGRRLLPILALSLGAYNHLLYSAYVLVPMLLVVFSERREAGARRTWRLIAAAVVPLIPIAVYSMSRGSAMTPEWLELLRLRSSHHSFPSAFFADLPEAAGLLALTALAVSALPLDRRRLLAFFLVGTALQFLVGTLFTEFHPLKAVLQYQPHRSWRFLLLLLLAAIAASVVSGFKQGGASRLAALVTGAIVFIPGLEPLLPVAVIGQAVVARPAPSAWARTLAAAVLVCVGGWGDQAIDWTSFLAPLPGRLISGTVLAAAALAVLIKLGMDQGGLARPAFAGLAALFTLFWLGPDIYGRARARWESGDWVDVQTWARRSTPVSSVFLTPPRETGFRVFSERTTVAEWKDGTQQYFDDGFVREWGARIETIGDLPKRNDAEVRAIGQLFRATHVVLPARQHTSLLELYRNDHYAVYRVR